MFPRLIQESQEPMTLVEEMLAHHLRRRMDDEHRVARVHGFARWDGLVGAERIAPADIKEPEVILLLSLGQPLTLELRNTIINLLLHTISISFKSACDLYSAFFRSCQPDRNNYDDQSPRKDRASPLHHNRPHPLDTPYEDPTLMFLEAYSLQYTKKHPNVMSGCFFEVT